MVTPHINGLELARKVLGTQSNDQLPAEIISHLAVCESCNGAVEHYRELLGGETTLTAECLVTHNNSFIIISSSEEELLELCHDSDLPGLTEALEHLKTCAACAAKIAYETNLWKAVCVVYNSKPTDEPFEVSAERLDELDRRVYAQLDAERQQAETE